MWRARDLLTRACAIRTARCIHRRLSSAFPYDRRQTYPPSPEQLAQIQDPQFLLLTSPLRMTSGKRMDQSLRDHLLLVGL